MSFDRTVIRVKQIRFPLSTEIASNLITCYLQDAIKEALKDGTAVTRLLSCCPSEISWVHIELFRKYGRTF